MMICQKYCLDYMKHTKTCVILWCESKVGNVGKIEVKSCTLQS